MSNNASLRGQTDSGRQAFIYRGIQVIPTLDGGWLCIIGGRHYAENSEDEICFEIDAMHLMIETVKQRNTSAPCAGVAASTLAISGERKRSPSRPARRFSISHKRGAA